METGTVVLLVGGVALVGGGAYLVMKKRRAAAQASLQSGTAAVAGTLASFLPAPIPASYSGPASVAVANKIGDVFTAVTSKSEGSWFTPAAARINPADAAKAAETAALAAATNWVSNGEEFIGTPPGAPPAPPIPAPVSAAIYDARAAAAGAAAAAAAAARGAAAASIGNVGSTANGLASAAAGADKISIGAVLAAQKLADSVVTNKTNAVATVAQAPIQAQYVAPTITPPPISTAKVAKAKIVSSPVPFGGVAAIPAVAQVVSMPFYDRPEEF